MRSLVFAAALLAAGFGACQSFSGAGQGPDATPSPDSAMIDSSSPQVDAGLDAPRDSDARPQGDSGPESDAGLCALRPFFNDDFTTGKSSGWREDSAPLNVLGVFDKGEARLSTTPGPEYYTVLGSPPFIAAGQPAERIEISFIAKFASENADHIFAQIPELAQRGNLIFRKQRNPQNQTKVLVRLGENGADFVNVEVKLDVKIKIEIERIPGANVIVAVDVDGMVGKDSAPNLPNQPAYLQIGPYIRLAQSSSIDATVVYDDVSIKLCSR